MVQNEAMMEHAEAKKEIETLVYLLFTPFRRTHWPARDDGAVDRMCNGVVKHFEDRLTGIIVNGSRDFSPLFDQIKGVDVLNRLHELAPARAGEHFWRRWSRALDSGDRDLLDRRCYEVRKVLQNYPNKAWRRRVLFSGCAEDLAALVEDAARVP